MDVGASSASTAALIATSESDFVDLIVPCSEILRDNQRAGGRLIAINVEDRARKITEQRGAALPELAVGKDLENIGSGEVGAVGEKLPTARIASRSQNGG